MVSVDGYCSFLCDGVAEPLYRQRESDKTGNDFGLSFVWRRFDSLQLCMPLLFIADTHDLILPTLTDILAVTLGCLAFSDTRSLDKSAG